MFLLVSTDLLLQLSVNSKSPLLVSHILATQRHTFSRMNPAILLTMREPRASAKIEGGEWEDIHDESSQERERKVKAKRHLFRRIDTIIPACFIGVPKKRATDQKEP
jgi:hypothetical protein